MCLDHHSTIVNSFLLMLQSATNRCKQGHVTSSFNLFCGQAWGGWGYLALCSRSWVFLLLAGSMFRVYGGFSLVCFWNLTQCVPLNLCYIAKPFVFRNYIFLAALPFFQSLFLISSVHFFLSRSPPLREAYSYIPITTGTITLQVILKIPSSTIQTWHSTHVIIFSLPIIRYSL